MFLPPVAVLSALAVVFLGCLAAPLLSRTLGREAGWVLALPLVCAAVLLTVATTTSPGPAVAAEMPWMPTIGVDLALNMDGLAFLFSLLVTVIGAAVLVYSARYLSPGRGHWSFMTLMAAFATAMLVLVLADDLVVLFVAWEATTLCSFFLIARSGPVGREPAVRTLLVTAAGGLSLLGAVTLMAVSTGTTRISDVLAHPVWVEDQAFTTAAALLIAGAAFTKSAQFPFHAWLPDSMVAISPISTYLHAAAMVKAGIYLLMRFSPVLAGLPVWSVLLVATGLVTALVGAVAAMRRHDLKELLAYSTISQLGLLVALVGVGTPAALSAAVVHTVAHALFKSALFMFVGIIDHRAMTRDIRELAAIRLRMPVTAAGLGLAAGSMAGVPALLGFVSKESMIGAFLKAPLPSWTVALTTTAVALTSVLTFAYAGRIVLGAFGGRGGSPVAEAPAPFLVAPVAAAAAGLALGLAPALLDDLISGAASAASGTDVGTHLTIWHGVDLTLAVSALVLAAGTLLVLARRHVERLLAPLDFPVSALAVVDAIRKGTIGLGAIVARWAGSRSPRRHLAIPSVLLVVIAALAAPGLGPLPPAVGDRSRPMDWVLVAMVAAGVLAAVRARTRIAAVVVTGVVGFSMTLWFLVLGAVDVALTQLLVEILTVTVMVLLLRRLPAHFRPESPGRRMPAAVIALGTGTAAAAGVGALTGRREMTEAADFYVRQGEQVTGGANLVNTILVDFRALDTLGELTALAVAGMVIAALLQSRPPLRTRPADVEHRSPLADGGANVVFLRTVTRLVGPVTVALSILLLLRGHQEPGGGFIAALVAGAWIALRYLAAPADSAARIRWPYLALTAAGIVVAVLTGLFGFVEGSFLTPLQWVVFGVKVTSALVFDVGVYLAVIGTVLAAFTLLGQDGPGLRTDEHEHEHDDPVHGLEEAQR